MSDASHRARLPSRRERRVLELLSSMAKGPSLAPEWLNSVRVSELQDGGMGSLRLIGPWSSPGSSFGSCAAAAVFRDTDGVEVYVSLYLDAAGSPFELDVWKVDFESVIEFPDDASRYSPVLDLEVPRGQQITSTRRE